MPIPRSALSGILLLGLVAGCAPAGPTPTSAPTATTLPATTATAPAAAKPTAATSAPKPTQAPATSPVAAANPFAGVRGIVDPANRGWPRTVDTGSGSVVIGQQPQRVHTTSVGL